MVCVRNPGIDQYRSQEIQLFINAISFTSKSTTEPNVVTLDPNEGKAVAALGKVDDMAALRELARSGRRDTQERIKLRTLGFRSARQSTPTPILESNVSDIPDSIQYSKQVKFHSFQLLDSLVQSYRSAAKVWDSRFPGWRKGIIGFSILSATVLMINITSLIWAVSHLDQSPYATMTMQSCRNINGLYFWVSLVINVFSTALLAGSNYCMQCLSSPTRKEIDAQHKQSSWLNIGILSWRNVQLHRKRRIALLVALLLSSVPLQFLYNSAVVVGGAVQAYDMAVVTPAFLTNGTWTQHGRIDFGLRYEERLRRLQDRAIDGQAWNQSRWENISASDCKDHYKLYQSDLGSVLLITESDQTTGWKPFDGWVNGEGRKGNGSVLWYELIFPRQSSDPTLSWYYQSAEEWRVYDEQSSQILYCLALKVPYRCRLQIHVWFLLAVVVLNVVKIACMLWCLKEQKGTPFLVVGDAIASFLKSPCKHSRRMCLWSQEVLTRALKRRKDGEDDEEEEAKAFHKIPLRYHHSVSFSRWIVYSISCILAMLTAVYWYNEILLKYRGDHVFPTNLRSFWDMGFGNVYHDSSGLLSPPWCDILSMNDDVRKSSWRKCITSRHETYHMFVGALPQIVISAIYVVLNHQLTLMVQLRDWTRLALHRQPLRVSQPEAGSEQISNWWLSLPYGYSFALLSSSVALSWCASQAVYFYRLRWYDDDGNVFREPQELAKSLPDPFHSYDPYAIGYSVLGVICSVVLGIVIFLASLLLALRKCVPGLPLGPTNSFIVAAACHPPENDGQAAKKLIQWGALALENDNESHPLHCTITSQKVEAPVEGCRYV